MLNLEIKKLWPFEITKQIQSLERKTNVFYFFHFQHTWETMEHYTVKIRYQLKG